MSGGDVARWTVAQISDALASDRDAVVSRSIRLDDCTDWGCQGSDDDRANYEQAVAEAIVAHYPEASVTVQCLQIASPRCVVTTRGADGRILTDDATARDEEDIAGAVVEIAAEVWDRGEFWASSEVQS
jgi:hypothetical protein